MAGRAKRALIASRVRSEHTRRLSRTHGPPDAPGGVSGREVGALRGRIGPRRDALISSAKGWNGGRLCRGLRGGRTAWTARASTNGTHGPLRRFVRPRSGVVQDATLRRCSESPKKMLSGPFELLLRAVRRGYDPEGGARRVIDAWYRHDSSPHPAGRVHKPARRHTHTLMHTHAHGHQES